MNLAVLSFTIILCLLCRASAANLILLLRRTGFNQYNLTCVAGVESSKYAMLWSRYEPEYTDIKVISDNNYIDKFDTEHFLTDSFKYNIFRSTRCNLPGVFDRRWEDFKFINKYTVGNNLHYNTFDSYSGNATTINLSIMLYQYVIIQLVTDEGKFCAEIKENSAMEKFSTCEILTNILQHSSNENDYKEKWHHFLVYKKNDDYILKRLNAKYSMDSEKKYNEFKFNALTVVSETRSIWKVHDYSLLLINKELNKQLFKYYVRKPTNLDYICFSFYLFMDSPKCAVTLTLCNKNCRLVYVTKTFSNKAVNWTEEQISLKDNTVDKVYVFIRKSNCDFAAIDDFKHCNPNENRRLTLETDNYHLSCLSLFADESAVSYKPPTLKKKSTGNEEFSKFLQTEKEVICDQENCYCANGFKGNWCDEDPVPTIRIEEVAATSATVVFEIEAYYSTLQINLNGIDINTVTVDGNFCRYQFQNLTPGSVYTLRARFCSSSACSPSSSRNITTETCNVLTRNNVFVTNSTNWFSLTLINFNNHSCPPYFFEVGNGNDFQILHNGTTITNLKPLQDYSVLVKLLHHFQNQTRMSMQPREYYFIVSAQTMYSVPDEVRNIQTNHISPTEVSVKFDPPNGRQFIQEYVIAYKIVNSACGDINDSQVHYKHSKNTCLTLFNLQPYNTYELSIQAVNDKGSSTVQIYKFKTLPTEQINAAENFIGVSGTAWKFPSCEIMEGPLAYKVLAKCMEKWCSGFSNETQFQIFEEINKANDFLSNLPRFSKNHLIVTVGRTKTSANNFIKEFEIFTPPGKPPAVTDVKIYTKQEQSFSLKFRPSYPPTGDSYYMVVVCNYNACQNVVNVKNCTLWDDFLCADVDNLTPHWEYNITVWAGNYNVSELTKTALRVNMQPAAPEAPADFSSKKIEQCGIELQWSHPDATNGQLMYFIVTMTHIQSRSISTVEVSAKEEARRYATTLTSLLNNTIYEAHVQAFNGLPSNSSNIITFETCSSTSTIAWVSISISVLLSLLIVAGVAIIILKIRNKRAEKGVHLFDPLELQRLKDARVTMVFQKNEFSVEIEKNISFEVFHDKVMNEYVDPNDVRTVADNISHVDGWKGPKTYVSCRSPSSNSSSNNFWESVWNESINIIICFQTVEESKLPGRIYWPVDEYTVSTENLSIICDYTQSFSDFFVQNLTITKVGQSDRKVKHVNFISYPPDDIPTFPFSYIIFLNHVKILDKINQKMLVHCSDGENRTGVFIMCYDFMRTQVEVIHLSKYLDEIRNNNPRFINSIIHYKFLYFLIDEILSGRSTRIPENTFMRQYETLYRDKLEDEFNYIEKRKYVYAMLKSAIPEDPLGIAKASVLGYQGKTTYWTTGFSDISKRTLWEYVKNRNIKVIVMLQDMGEKSRTMWPQQIKQLMVYRGFKITKQSYSNSCYKLTMDVNGVTDDVFLLYFDKWKDNNNIPPHRGEFYKFYNFYTTIKTGADVLLCCQNGYTACGLFLGFDFVIQKLQYENIFDLCWAVRSINWKKNIFLDCIEQHQFIYSTILYYLEYIEPEASCDENIYSNLKFDDTYMMTRDGPEEYMT